MRALTLGSCLSLTGALMACVNGQSTETPAEAGNNSSVLASLDGVPDDVRAAAAFEYHLICASSVAGLKNATPIVKQDDGQAAMSFDGTTINADDWCTLQIFGKADATKWTFLSAPGLFYQTTAGQVSAARQLSVVIHPLFKAAGSAAPATPAVAVTTTPGKACVLDDTLQNCTSDPASASVATPEVALAVSGTYDTGCVQQQATGKSYDITYTFNNGRFTAYTANYNDGQCASPSYTTPTTSGTYTTDAKNLTVVADRGNAVGVFPAVGADFDLGLDGARLSKKSQ